MSRIDDLIAEMCPNGVGFKALGEVCTVLNGFAFKSELFNTRNEGLPLIRIRDVNTGYSDTFYSGEYDDKWVVENGDILIGMDGDFRANRWRYGRALLNQRVCRLQDFSDAVIPDFIYYQIQDELDRIHSSITGSTVKHLSSRELERSRIPVPPLEVQREIVRILDQFTQLEAELEAELEARRAQYEHYRDQLLTFREAEGVTWVSLGEIGSIFGGLTGKSKSDFANGNARFVAYTNVFNNIAVDLCRDDRVHIGPGENQRALERGDILFTGSSETADEVAMSSVVVSKPEEATYLNSFSIGVRPRNSELLDPNFSKHLFRSGEMRRQLVSTASGVTRFNVSKRRLAKVLVPIPSLKRQKDIATSLDKFDALVNDLRAGLPAEIAARRKQYEYYRDKLLTFKEAF